MRASEGFLIFTTQLNSCYALSYIDKKRVLQQEYSLPPILSSPHFWWVLKTQSLNFLSDVDECSTGKHMCSEQCENLAGTYRCGCKTGYRVATDKISCVGKIFGYFFCILKPIFHWKLGLRWLLNTNEINTQKKKCTLPMRKHCIGDPTQPIFH